MKIFKCDECNPGCMLKTDDDPDKPLYCPFSGSDNVEWKDVTNDFEQEKDKFVDKIYNECLNLSIRLKL